ncbi:hypothetical protein ACWGOQ_0003305 [Aquimarina sp. M1]
MAPLKFEDSIKEKLEQRTIEPSAETWNILEQQLNDQHSHKKVKNYWWLGIAASIAGFLILSTVFIMSDEKIEPSNRELVDASEDSFKEKKSTDFVEIIPEELIQETKKEQADKEAFIKYTKVAKSHDGESSSLKNSKHKEDIQEENNNQNRIRERIFKTSTTTTIAIELDKGVYDEGKSLQLITKAIESKIADVVEKVKELEKNNETVSDEEVDALLRKAQLEITTEEILKSNTVSASALLLDVESELDESFKDRVFEALKTGFEKLKTTVAERDN